jgi:uncharacterized membrane-anchored protein YhcB (DUF1043 family)
MKVMSILIAGLMTLSLSAAPVLQSEALQTHMAALKESLERSRQQIKQYEWTETTIVLLNGEEKSHKQYLNHYGADASLKRRKKK